MTRHVLRIHPRYIRRQFLKAVGKSIPKILTELITNSDDSYKRMKNQNDPRVAYSTFGSIEITADRKKHVIRVTDQAQGISGNEMKEKFVWYGSDSDDRSKGVQTRSLFGKGLRDVLFTQKVGFVKSIKNGVSYTAKFYWGKSKDSDVQQPIININRGPRVNDKLRASWGIYDNGTLVEFRCREDISFPLHETLLEKVNNFYMLMKINRNPERTVFLKTIDKSKKEEKDRLKYELPKGDLILAKELLMEFEDHDFSVDLRILRCKGNLIQGGLGYEQREGGLLLLDEDDNVLDLTLFGFDTDPSASKLFGEIRINGVGSFIRAKLNSKQPEEILNETREGLVKSHKFYRTLAKLINPILEPIVREEERLSRSKGEFSDETIRRHKDAMEILNKLYKELVGKTTSGDGFQGKSPFLPDFISFIKPETTITEQVVTPIALLINCMTIKNGAVINITTNLEELSAIPEELIVEHSKAKEGLLIKILHLKGSKAMVLGSVKAQVLNHSTQIDVSVVEKSIFYPQGGIEFNPMQLRLPEGKRRKLRLYIDCSKVPLNSLINFSCDSKNFRISTEKVQFTEDMKISSEIGLAITGLSGHGIGQETTIKATSGSHTAIASAIVVSKKKRDPPTEHGGRFKPPKFTDIPNLKVQTWLRTNDGTILINLLDPTNKEYFGDYPYKAADVNPYCQARLADLVLDECLNEIVSNAWGKSLPRRFPNNPEVDIRRYVAEMKFEFGPQVHKYFVTLDHRKI